jgi:protocatechuate 3,4-dioxygenase, beta subunit
MKYKFWLFVQFLSNIAIAVVPTDGKISSCELSPIIYDGKAPSKFDSTNNLVMPDVSGFYKAEGMEIKIYGRVFDSKCVPVSDAKIYVWQANSRGYIQYSPFNKPKWFDPNFNGSGIINSDNMGRFDLMTIMPGSHNGITPHINVRVEHPKLPTLYTKIYFPNLVGGKIIDSRPILNSKKAARASAIPLKTDNIYVIDLTMHQYLPNKGY